MQEQWRQIESFEGYEVSDLGNVRSWWAHTCGPRVRLAKPRLMVGSAGGENSPYLRVTITSNGKKYTRRIHQSVLVAFVSPKPPGRWGLHNDGDFNNNCLSNLRWGTPKENADDRTAHGRTLYGSVNHKSRLTAEAVAAIRNTYGAGRATQVELAQVYKVSQNAISAVVRGKTWAHA